MGCNSRTSYWDFPDPEEASFLNFTPNVSFGSQNTEENCSGYLKLGSLGDLNNFMERLKNPMVAPSSSGSYKRARAHNNALQVPSCLVDGCVADLSKCRDYHKRHKVCEGHSKTPIVTIGGQERRFCQQCSRFHSLEEFDDNKRSCRKRLDGHNRRRRKPQSDSLSLNHSKYIPTHQDSKLISYGTQYFQKSALKSSTWNDAIKVQNNHLYAPNSQLNLKTINFSSPLSQGYGEEIQFPFLEGAAVSSVHISGSNSSSKMPFPDGFDRVINCSRASSLLSSPRTDTCGFNPMHMVHPPAHSAVPNTSHYSGLAMDSIPVANNGSNRNANMGSPEMIINCPDPCHETISFSWG